MIAMRPATTPRVSMAMAIPTIPPTERAQFCKNAECKKKIIVNLLFER